MSSLTRPFFFDCLFFHLQRMSSLTISQGFFLSHKCVLTDHDLLFVVVFFFLIRCPHSPDPFSLIAFCFYLQRMSSLIIFQGFFSFQKCVLTHHNLLFVVYFFSLKRCPHSPDRFFLIFFVDRQILFILGNFFSRELATLPLAVWVGPSVHRSVRPSHL